MERIFSLLTGLATGLAYVVAIAGTPYGIYHAFDRHDNAQGFISVFIPPFAWYMAVEAIGWHDDFAGVDWSQRIQNDARTAILLLSAASENDAIRADKVAAAVEEFSEKLAQYPIDKRAKVKSVVDSFLAYEEALSNDLAVEFDRELSGTGDGKFRFQSSAKTMELERLVRQHPGIDDVLKGRALAMSLINEKLGSVDLRAASPTKIQKLRTVAQALQVAVHLKLERMRKVHREMFGEPR